MKKYLINQHVIIKDADNVAQYIIDNMDDSFYDDMLNDCYGTINICGIEYDASIALYRTDEVAYNCGKNDYYDSLYSDILDELENMEEDDFTDIYGFDIVLTRE